MSVFTVVTLIAPALVLFAAFLGTERYLFYYLAIVASLLAAITPALLYPMLLNRGWMRVGCLGLAVVAYLIVNLTVFAVDTMLTDPEERWLISMPDPIYSEFVTEKVMMNSQIELLIDRTQVLVENYQLYGETFEARYLNRATVVADSIVAKQDVVEPLLSRLKFHRNRAFPEAAPNQIALVRQMSEALTRLSAIAPEYEEQIDDLLRKSGAVRQDLRVLRGQYDNAVAVYHALSDLAEGSGRNVDELYGVFREITGLSDETAESPSDKLSEIETEGARISAAIKALDAESFNVRMNVLILDELNQLGDLHNQALTRLNRLIQRQTEVIRWKTRFGL